MAVIEIGLAGWGDHDDLYPEGLGARSKLKAYSEFFDCVEVDSSFYAVLPERNYERWAEETPGSFRFVVKAYQGMTGHSRGAGPYADEEAMFAAFRSSVVPLVEAGKLAMVLLQYPPWFDCTRSNVETLRRAKELMKELPVALEFRHQSWFEGDMRDKTLRFMRQEGWIHSVCDEPQAGSGSVPIVLAYTIGGMVLVRFHGRNTEGWIRKEGRNWREVRYLYNYSKDELMEWVEYLRQLEQLTDQVYVIFNNNSGGHAAGNAMELMELLGKPFRPLPPRQLDLFG